MKTILEILTKQENNEPLTKREQEILSNYLRDKKVRHSTSFIYHSRKLPEESNESAG